MNIELEVCYFCHERKIELLLYVVWMKDKTTVYENEHVLFLFVWLLFYSFFYKPENVLFENSTRGSLCYSPEEFVHSTNIEGNYQVHMNEVEPLHQQIINHKLLGHPMLLGRHGTFPDLSGIPDFQSSYILLEMTRFSPSFL